MTPINSFGFDPTSVGIFSAKRRIFSSLRTINMTTAVTSGECCDKKCASSYMRSGPKCETAFNDKFFLSDVIKRIWYVFRGPNEISDTFDLALGSFFESAFYVSLTGDKMRHGRLFVNSFDDITRRMSGDKKNIDSSAVKTSIQCETPSVLNRRVESAKRRVFLELENSWKAGSIWQCETPGWQAWSHLKCAALKVTHFDLIAGLRYPETFSIS